MPIKPANRSLYPKAWPSITAAIRERARYRCEWPGCGAAQYSVGHWPPVAGERRWRTMPGGDGFASFAEARAFADAYPRDDSDPGFTPMVIVLTVAHLDHDPTNCAPENLRAWCQRHHLAYDADHHKQTAYMSRREARNNLELF